MFELLRDAAENARERPSLLQLRADVWKKRLKLLGNQTDAQQVLQDVRFGLQSFYDGDVDALPKVVRNVTPSLVERCAIDRDFIRECWFERIILARDDSQVLSLCRLLTVPKDGDKHRICRDFSIK